MKSNTEKKAQQYYTSCMDANETIETLGAKPMLDLLDNVGGWSINGKFNVSTWSLQNSMHVLQNEYNMGGLFSWAVNEDDRNSSRHIIQVSYTKLFFFSNIYEHFHGKNTLTRLKNKKKKKEYLSFKNFTLNLCI